MSYTFTVIGIAVTFLIGLFAIQKFDKKDYLHKIKNIVNDIHISENINLTSDGFLGFAVNQEKRVYNIFKKLFCLTACLRKQGDL